MDNNQSNIMDTSLVTDPSLNRFLAGARLKSIPKPIHSANMTSINLNTEIPPKQPVPDLKDTVQRYLKSISPLLRDAEYHETERIVEEFEAGVGAELQRKLLERYECTENWMIEWIHKATYMGNRTPLIGVHSPGTVGPWQKFSCPEELFIFAGRLIAAVCEYDSMIKSGQIKQEVAGKDPLDMQQYTMMLGTHRRPNIPLDCLLHTDTSEHIIIMHNNEFFKLNVFDNSYKERTPISADKLTASLKELVGRSAMAGMPIGILTGNNRDSWAKDHKKLEACGGNGKIIKDIEKALFILCLDQAMSKDLYREKNYESIGALRSLSGVSCDTNAGNRWRDKTVQYIVSFDGFVGMTFEHTPCGGIPIAALHEHVLKYIENRQEEKYDEPKEFPIAEHLRFEIPEGIDDSICAAARTLDELSRDMDMECFAFKDFGTIEIKKNKMSPDSFIQMAIQLAYYKVHNKPPGHYEAAALNRFRSTKTERVMCTCAESIEFSRVMVSNVSKEKKKKAMLKAIDTHKKLVVEAITGQGTVRHLYGLKTIAENERSRMPEFFTDIGYKTFTHLNLSSSQVPFKTASFMCYGPRIPDGYACCYNPRPQDILVACSCFNACEETCAKKFAEALKQSFCEMIEIASEC